MRHLLTTLLAITCLLILARCSAEKPVSLPEKSSDTLYTTFVHHPVQNQPDTLLRIITVNGNESDTVFSDTVPSGLTPTAFGSSCGGLKPIYVYLKQIDTISRLVDYPNSEDTIYITDTIYQGKVYSDTTDMVIDISKRKPYFFKKDSMVNILGLFTEGALQYVYLSAFHYDGDSATVKLIDNPSWVQLGWMSVNQGYGNCWFYPICENGVPVLSSCTFWISKSTARSSASSDCDRPYLTIAADSTALDSTFNWKIVITNKFGLSDTINVSSTVAPFPLSCNNNSDQGQITYSTNNGSVSPEYFRRQFYTFFSDGSVNHKTTDWQDSIYLDTTTTTESPFYDSLTSFISENEIADLDSSYWNMSWAGGGTRQISINTSSLVKSISVYGYWEEDLPAALWQLEQMLSDKVKELFPAD